MTMPNLMNCAHSSDGWCLNCVTQQQNELMFLRNFYETVKFYLGPADAEIYEMIKEEYVSNGNVLPEGYV